MGMLCGMSDPNIVKTLRSKRDAIEGAIALYEKKVETSKRDLSHVNATLAMFEAPEGRSQFPVYMDTLRLFRRGEIVTICKAALAQKGRWIRGNWRWSSSKTRASMPRTPCCAAPLPFT